MTTSHEGQQTDSHDHDPTDTVVRSTPRGDTLGRPVSALVVVIVGEDSSITRYASWLADTYEAQTVRRGEMVSTRPETDVVVVDQRRLTTAVDGVRETVSPNCGGCRVLAPATLHPCDAPIDEDLPEPVSRDGLLNRVGAGLRIATYDGTVAELLSATMHRRKLRNCSRAGHGDHTADIAFLSERIDELHRRIDDELSDVESQYARLLAPRTRPPTRQKTENERA